MSVLRERGRPAIAWMAIVASSCLVVSSIVSFRVAQPASSDHAASPAEVRLVEARHGLETATLDVVALRMLDAVGVDGDRSDEVDRAVANVREAAAEINDLADGAGAVAAEAAALLDDVDPEALSDPEEADIEELFYVAEDASRYAGRSEIVDSRIDAVFQLAFTGALPTHALVEAIAADVSVNDRDVAPAMVDFLDRMIEVVRTEGGWFGPDASTPLDDSVWIEIDEAREQLPEQLALIETLIVASPLVAHDAWMRELGESDAAPPSDLAEVVAMADALQNDLAAVIVGDVLAEEAARAADDDTLDALWVGIAVVALAAAIGLLVAGVRRITRSAAASRELAALATVDALTGVGNRLDLEERTRALVSDPAFERHIVMMVDLDRFKILNDIHGHAAGDAVLVAVAERLTEVAAAISATDPERAHTVVRLGGDEFLLTVHGPSTLERDALEERLDAIRSDVVAHDGKALGLAFSIGIADADGPRDLSDLMNQADLAVYEDKARRATIREGAAAEAVALRSGEHSAGSSSPSGFEHPGE